MALFYKLENCWKFRAFMEQECWPKCSQKPNTDLYHKLDESMLDLRFLQRFNSVYLERERHCRNMRNITPPSSGSKSNPSRKLPSIAQAVSRRLQIATARVRSRVRSYGICGGQSDTGPGFLGVLGFPCQFLLHWLLHTHHVASGAGTIGQTGAAAPSGLDSVSLHE
jgi:hypothetical protein